MAFVSICARVFDPDGSVLLDADARSELTGVSRRVSRTATLDGGVLVVDNGYAAGDQSLLVSAPVSRTADVNLQRMAALYPEITVSHFDGCFLGVIERYAADQNTAKIRILIKEKLSGD